MYFAPVPFVSEVVLNKALEGASGHFKEYEAFYWVPVEPLLNSITTGKLKIDDKELQLFGPFQKMLQEERVSKILKKSKETANSNIWWKEIGLLHTADQEVSALSKPQREQKEETQIFESIALKAETNLLIKQFRGISEAQKEGHLTPEFIKKNKNPRDAFLKNLRQAAASGEKTFSHDPCERSLSLFLLKKELGNQWVDVGTADRLNEEALRGNIQTYLKREKKFQAASDSQKVLDTLVIFIRREIGQFYTLMARLHELILGFPTSPSSGLRATDLYFGEGFPRTFSGLVEWLGKNDLTNGQNFCTSLGIWGCTGGQPVSFFSDNSSRSSINLKKITQESMAFLGIPTQAAHLVSVFKNQSDQQLGDLIQCLISRKNPMGYVSGIALDGKPISVTGKEGECFPLLLEAELRAGKIQLEESH